MNSSFVKMKISNLLSKPGFYILVGSIVSNYFNILPYPFILFTILYLLILANRVVNTAEKESEVKLFDAAIPETLDALILECLSLYIIFNIGPNKKYIAEAEEPKIVKDIIERVLFRMSPTMLYKLRAYYNEEMVEDVITEKIYMVVTNFVIQNNEIEDDDKELILEDDKKQLINIL